MAKEKTESPLPYLAIILMIAGTAGLSLFGFKFWCGKDWPSLAGSFASLILLALGIWLFIHSQIERNKREELERIKISNPSADLKKTFIVPVLAAAPGAPVYMGMLHTEAPIKVMGQEIDFYRLIEGAGDPSMNGSNLPLTAGYPAAHAAGLSVRPGDLFLGLAHHPNSFVLDRKDLNVKVMLIYNAEVQGVTGGAMRIISDTSRYQLNPLDKEMLLCDFLPIDQLKGRVFDALSKLIIAELPEWLTKNKP